jgi:uncharacterized membrane protein
VLGWANHEGLWRSNDPEVARRSADIRAFYSASDPRSAAMVVRKYKVTYVIVGDMERRTYPDADRVASLPFLTPAFPGGTTIYRVVAGSP